MIIKQSKLNELLKELILENFDPLDFNLPNLRNMTFNSNKYNNGITSSKYMYNLKKNNQYFFSFHNFNSGQIGNPEYCPGVNFAIETINAYVSFDKLKGTFNAWLKELRTEIAADEYYESIFKKSEKPFLIINEQSNDFFSEKEISLIESHFQEIKGQIHTLNLSKEQIKGLEAKFDEFVNSARVDKKGKWLDYIFGGLFSAVISLAINPDTANRLYNLIKAGIDTIIFNNGLLLINP